MDTLYKWRVQEKDRSGKLRWRLMRAPMTEETARFWALNNNRVVERIDWPGAVKFSLQFDDAQRSGLKEAAGT